MFNYPYIFFSFDNFFIEMFFKRQASVLIYFFDNNSIEDLLENKTSVAFLVGSGLNYVKIIIKVVSGYYRILYYRAKKLILDLIFLSRSFI